MHDVKQNRNLFSYDFAGHYGTSNNRHSESVFSWNVMPNKEESTDHGLCNSFTK